MKAQELKSFFMGNNEIPVPVKSEGQVMGYWTKELAEEFKKEVNNNPYYSSAAKKLLLDKTDSKIIVPIYAQDGPLMENIIESFKKCFKLFSILGFYDGEKICMCVTNLRDLFGNCDKGFMYNILTHEFQHKAAGEISTFHKDPTVRRILNDFSNYFCDFYFGSELPDANRKAYVDYLINIKSEYNKGTNFEALLKKRLGGLKELYHGFEEGSSLYKKGKSLYNDISSMYYGGWPDANYMEPAYKAYQKLGIKCETLIFQEFVFPSEIVCVMAGFDRDIGNELIEKYLPSYKR